MKKLALLIVSIILFSLCAVPAVAAEYNEPGEQEKNINRKILIAGGYTKGAAVKNATKAA